MLLTQRIVSDKLIWREIGKNVVQINILYGRHKE